MCAERCRKASGQPINAKLCRMPRRCAGMDSVADAKYFISMTDDAGRGTVHSSFHTCLPQESCQRLYIQNEERIYLKLLRWFDFAMPLEHMQKSHCDSYTEPLSQKFLEVSSMLLLFEGLGGEKHWDQANMVCAEKKSSIEMEPL